MEAARLVEAGVREELRRRISSGRSRGSDAEVRALVEQAVVDYDLRSLDGSLPEVGDRSAVARAVLASVSGFGALQRYFDDPDVEEIWINEPGKVFVARGGVPELTTTILDADTVADLVERMLASTGRRVDLSSPFVDASLPDGSRLHVVIPDVTRKHWAVNVRRFVARARRLDDLVGLGSLTAPAAAFLAASVAAGLNVLVSGGTQAGKTTLLNCLLAAVPPQQRIITCEEVFEIQAPARDLVAMQCRQPNLEGTGEIPLRRLVKEALRMRPDRLVVGEVRQAESLDLLIALNSGLPGMATIHANSAADAVAKLCTLPLLAGDNVTSAFVVPAVASSVDLVVHVDLDTDGSRRVAEVLAVPGRVEGGVVETVTVYGRETGGTRLVRASGWPPHRQRYARAGIDLARLLGSAAVSGTVVGAVFGVGAFCVWWSCWPRPARAPRVRRRRVANLLQRAGFPGVPPVVVVLGSLAAALTAFVATVAASGVLVLGGCAAAAGGCLPVALLRRRAAQRSSVRSAQWPDVVDQLASSVRAGMSLPDGVCALAQRGPELLRPDFAVFAAGYRASGAFETELRRLADRLADPVFDRLAAALRMTRQVGGSDLGRTLRTLSTYLREDARTRGELLARQSWTVSAARLAVAAPWIVLALLASRPGALEAYSSATGAAVLLGGAVASALAYWLMLRFSRLPQPQRVFA